MIAHVSTLAFFAGLAAAVHAPVGEPLGNPITAPLIEVVPACKAYTIQWTPTTPNTVSLLLLRGPSTNVVPLGAPLAEGIANSGSFVWTPAATLEPDTSRYGLQLIDDVTGQYQYSTQFGISTDLCEVVISTTEQPIAEATEAGYGYPTEIAEATTAEPATTEAAGYPVPSVIDVVSTTAFVPTSTYVPIGTGLPISNSTILQPSKSLSVPATLKTTATGVPSSTVSPLPEFTGAASSLRAGLGLTGAVAGLVFML